MSDTYDADWVPSGIPFNNMAPADNLGLDAPSATFATGDIRVDGDTVTTRAKAGGYLDANEPAPTPEA